MPTNHLHDRCVPLSKAAMTVPSAPSPYPLDPQMKEGSGSVRPIELIHANDIRPYDILSGKCTTAHNNIGNRRFRITVSLLFPKYHTATTRKAKSEAIDSLIYLLLDVIGARFLKPLEDYDSTEAKSGRYFELSRKQSRERVAHALRNMAIAIANDKTKVGPRDSVSESIKSSSSLPPKRSHMPSFLQRSAKWRKSKETGNISKTGSTSNTNHVTPTIEKSTKHSNAESDLLAGPFDNDLMVSMEQLMDTDSDSLADIYDDADISFFK